MKKIYLTEKPEHIRSVFGVEGPVYSKEDILKDAKAFENTEIIFSTWGMPVFSEEEIGRCFPSLKAVFYGAGSVQRFARPFLRRGVKIFSAWAANAVPVAEYTVAQIILANKGFFIGSRMTKTAVFSQAREKCAEYPGNYGAKIGIIGAGMIGKLVIRMLKDYKLKVFVFDPFLSDEKAKELGVEKCDLATLFSTCSVVSNHLADNDRTRGMLGGALFASMPQNATFINTGRGAQVVEKELCEVLKMRPDLTAILDVTFPEPPEKDHPFYSLENCILTPHIAGSAGNEVRRMGAFMEEEYESFIKNEPCRYEVSEKMLETMA